MSNLIKDGLPTLVAAVDIPVYSLVKYTASGYDIAAATDTAVGTAMRTVKAGEYLEPRGLNPGQLSVGIASGAIPVNTDVVQDAAGKLKARPTSGGGTARLIGRTFDDAAAADLDWVNYVPIGAAQVITIPP